MHRSIEIRSTYPAKLLRFDSLDDLPSEFVVLPSFMFDPIWIAHDTGIAVNDYCNRFEGFFEGETPVRFSQLFEGSFTHHWHNQWRQEIRPASIAGQVYSQICGQTKHKREGSV
jgi:hypothetical protein